MAGMTVQRRRDNRVPHVFMHKVADVRGGVSVKVSELGKDFLFEGAVLSKPDNGICHVVKVAQLTATSSSSNDIKVKKNHNFKVGDYVMAEVGGLAYAITKIVEGKDADTITVGTTLGELEQGSFIVEAAGESSSSTSKLKYEPFALVGTGKVVDQNQNLDTDAWVIGVTKGNELPGFVADKLKGIINY